METERQKEIREINRRAAMAGALIRKRMKKDRTLRPTKKEHESHIKEISKE